VRALVEFLSAPAPAPAPSSAASATATATATAAPISNADPKPSSSSIRDGGSGSGSGKWGSNTLLLTGAGISVASGLADYRGTAGTYTLNRKYRPIYFGEFCDSHEARKRYWARSFLGWTTMERARPNRAHEAAGKLGELGVVREVVTQSMFAVFAVFENDVVLLFSLRSSAPYPYLPLLPLFAVFLNAH
jgi:hypothetical protein